jgi:hypothetical protein
LEGWNGGLEDWNDDEIGEILTEENMRELGKIFLCGPTCELNGKTVPCFVGRTPPGSIISALLSEMLKNMDGL